MTGRAQRGSAAKAVSIRYDPRAGRRALKWSPSESHTRSIRWTWPTCKGMRPVDIAKSPKIGRASVYRVLGTGAG
jgi:hypothetical protein